MGNQPRYLKATPTVKGGVALWWILVTVLMLLGLFSIIVMINGAAYFLMKYGTMLALILTANIALIIYQMDGRPMSEQLKPRLVKIGMIFYCLTVLLVIQLPLELEWLSTMLKAGVATWLMVYIYQYVAAGSASKRPVWFLSLGCVVSASYIWMAEGVSSGLIVGSYLVAISALWISELFTRLGLIAQRGFRRVERWDVISLSWFFVLILAWRDFFSVYMVGVIDVTESMLLLTPLFESGLLFPVVWLFVAIFLYFWVLKYHRNKLANLHDYSEKLLKSIQDRELQLNLLHYDELQRQERETIDAERQTIYRDLHDGIGSRLVAAMYSLRSGKTTKAALENTLLSCLTDIKRIMNEDDLQEHRSLQEMFFEYCFTMDDLLSESGVEFAYEVPSDGEFYMLGRSSGTLMKMTQEIITNALKHSSAKSMHVKLEILNDSLIVSIREYNYDFSGLDVSAQAKMISSGAGLSNLKMRAFDIDATFSYDQRSDERVSQIAMKLIDVDALYLSDELDYSPGRRRQFLISQIGDLF